MPPRADAGWDRVVRWKPEQTAALDDSSLLTLLEETDRANIEAARESSAAFVEYVLTNEVDSSSLTNADFHREWHETIRDNAWSLIICPIGHAKTTHVSVGYVLWTLGRNPSARIALICDSLPQAKDRLGTVKRYIETSERLWKVFPHLKPAEGSNRPAPGESWSCESITINRTTIAKEASVQAFGTGARDLEGKRFDLMVFDDVLNFANTRTAEGCAKTIEWFDSTAITRLWPLPSSRAIVIGTPWSIFDLLAELQKRKGWIVRKYAAVENPDDPVTTWRPIWPDVWTLARLIERYENTPMLTFWRKYMCRITSDATSRFRAAWFASAKVLGAGRSFLKSAPVLLPTGRKLACFTGVDLGNSPRKKKAHGATDHGGGLTVLFTIAIDERARRLVVNIESGRWTGPVILDKIKDHWIRYGSRIIVEDNGVQGWMVQFAQMQMIPVVEFQTGANKYDESFGIESLAVELRGGMWLFPSGVHQDGRREVGFVEPELLATESELTAYSPDSHTGDRAMAMWFAREGAKDLIGSITAKLPTIPR